jgi:hypothetical protein
VNLKHSIDEQKGVAVRKLLKYRRPRARIVVSLSNGLDLGVPVELAQGLAGAKASELAAIEVTPTGLGLHWPKLDADLYLPTLLLGRPNEHTPARVLQEQVLSGLRRTLGADGDEQPCVHVVEYRCTRRGDRPYGIGHAGSRFKTGGGASRFAGVERFSGAHACREEWRVGGWVEFAWRRFDLAVVRLWF